MCIGLPLKIINCIKFVNNNFNKFIKFNPYESDIKQYSRSPLIILLYRFAD